LISFSGLRWGTITPTDIDGVIDYYGIASVFYEFKYAAAELQRGQELCLERLVDDAIHARKKAVAILARHDVYNATTDVRAKDCLVDRAYIGEKQSANGKGIWIPDGKGRTIQQFTDDFFAYVEKDARSGA